MTQTKWPPTNPGRFTVRFAFRLAHNVGAGPRCVVKMADHNIAAILFGASQYFQVMSERLISLAAHYRIPALYEWRDFVTAGRLMSHSTDRSEFARQAAVYVAPILEGAGQLTCQWCNRCALNL